MGSLARCRGCVRNGFRVSEELWSGTPCHELCDAGTGGGRSVQSGCKTHDISFCRLDFAVQSDHVLGRDLGNIWRRALPASESLPFIEPKLEMYVRCDL